MAQKNATPTKEQQSAIRAAGLSPESWTVIRDLPSQLIICHRVTKDVHLIGKIPNDCEKGGGYGR